MFLVKWLFDLYSFPLFQFAQTAPQRSRFSGPAGKIHIYRMEISGDENNGLAG